MTYITDEELALRIAQVLFFVNRPHLDACYEERNTADGQDGWDGFFCPRCGCSESSYTQRGCYSRYPTDAVSTLSLITFAENLNVGFSLYNIKHFETSKIEYEAVFYDPWDGPSVKEYEATDENLLRAIDLAFIKLMEDR